MSQRDVHRIASMIVCSAFALLYATASAAKGHASPACTGAYETGLEAHTRGHLREARESLLKCAKAACGVAIQKKCAAEAALLDSVIALVTPVVTDERGAPVVDVQVTVDGEPLTAQLDGRAYPIDPGLHEFSLSTGGGVLATQKILIVQGQRGALPILVHPPPKSIPKPSAPSLPVVAKQQKQQETKAASETASESSPASGESPASSHGAMPEQARTGAKFLLPSLVVGGIGVGTLAAAALADIWGNNDNNLLVTQCKPNCPPSSAEHIHTLYTTANILFGTGVVALGVSAWLFVLSRGTDVAAPSPSAAFVLDVKPSLSGAVGTIAGAF